MSTTSASTKPTISIPTKAGPLTTTDSLTKAEPPAWLMAMWKEVDDKTWGKGFDCFAENAVCNLGIVDWHGREAIRAGLRKFIDTGFTAHHEVLDYYESASLKVFRGSVAMLMNCLAARMCGRRQHGFVKGRRRKARSSRSGGVTGGALLLVLAVGLVLSSLRAVATIPVAFAYEAAARPGQLGMGTQSRTSLTLGELVAQGFLEEVHSSEIRGIAGLGFLR
jgi:hypothetical protein